MESNVTKMGINVTLAPLIPAGSLHMEDQAISDSREPTSLAGQLSDEELQQLRQCRNRAYSKVNQKKRQHLAASLSQYLYKAPANHHVIVSGFVGPPRLLMWTNKCRVVLTYEHI